MIIYLSKVNTRDGGGSASIEIPPMPRRYIYSST